ncbi:MAG: beta-galactosidase [Anaerolineae bacterium]|nr:beta-galactosidase [Anaerolineae bacterium]
MSTPFVLGVNYWPRRKGVAWWSAFDAEEVREEFGIIADLGLQVVRIFLLWDDWQPEPDVVAADCLRNLGVVLDIAAACGLRVQVTFFTGHMSGPNWPPRWLLDEAAPPPSPFVSHVARGRQAVQSSYRNPLHDPVALEAERLLLRTVISEYRDHPALWMWSLGNEPDLFAWPANAAAGRAWVREMKALIDAHDGSHPVTCGLHVLSLHFDNGFRVNDVFAETDVATMHAYPMYLPWARHDLDPDVVPYTCALTAALCGKPVLMEEWGGCTVPPGEASQVWEWEAYGEPRQQFMAAEHDLADYVAAVLPRLVEVGATGAMLWCFADYSPDLWPYPPYDEARHERFFGLVRPDGTLKPHAEVLRRFAASEPAVREVPARTIDLGVTPDDYYLTPTDHLLRLFQDFIGAEL